MSEKENYSKALVNVWVDYINWNKRRQAEGGFLLNTLKKFNCQKIFDACLGDGADSIHLLKNSFNVTSNDLDNLFIQKAKENANKQNVTLTITKYDWKDLDKHFEKKSFDAITCLGNSLTHLFSKKDRLKTLKNFLHILNDNGILIIDERNYQNILDKREEILSDEKFRLSNEFVYCGDNVRSRPIEISENQVRLEIKDERSGKNWHLLIYPFRRGELLNLLKEIGFTKIEQYSDYKKGFYPDAEFYQYVCQK